ncbi:hypothetical protein Ptc2401_00922 [Prosthecochloris sp. CIB 2401]|nr:hypothetical protein Ptc2401_00922 [Prosthecochloris sp. CIB 2401]
MRAQPSLDNAFLQGCLCNAGPFSSPVDGIVYGLQSLFFCLGPAVEKECPYLVEQQYAEYDSCTCNKWNQQGAHNASRGLVVNLGIEHAVTEIDAVGPDFQINQLSVDKGSENLYFTANSVI